MDVPGSFVRQLRSAIGCDRLVVVWNPELERFVVGEKLEADLVNWFHVVRNEDGSFRPLDSRTIADVVERDKARNQQMTAVEYVKAIEYERDRKNEKRREEVRYRFAHDAKHFAHAIDSM